MGKRINANFNNIVYSSFNTILIKSNIYYYIIIAFLLFKFSFNQTNEEKNCQLANNRNINDSLDPNKCNSITFNCCYVRIEYNLPDIKGINNEYCIILYDTIKEFKKGLSSSLFMDIHRYTKKAYEGISRYSKITTNKLNINSDITFNTNTKTMSTTILDEDSILLKNIDKNNNNEIVQLDKNNKSSTSKIENISNTNDTESINPLSTFWYSNKEHWCPLDCKQPNTETFKCDTKEPDLLDSIIVTLEKEVSHIHSKPKFSNILNCKDYSTSKEECIVNADVNNNNYSISRLESNLNFQYGYTKCDIYYEDNNKCSDDSIKLNKYYSDNFIGNIEISKSNNNLSNKVSCNKFPSDNLINIVVICPESFTTKIILKLNLFIVIIVIFIYFLL